MNFNAYLKDVKTFCLLPYENELLVWQYQYTSNSGLYHLFLTDIIEPTNGTKFQYKVLNENDFKTLAIIITPDILNENYKNQITKLFDQLFFTS